MVVEDAVSGVQAGHKGNFGLTLGLAREDNIKELQVGGADIVVEDLADIAAGFVREVTGFDRVMVYRFAEDKHGQVIAESTSRPDSFMDMHYPSSDIPEPARRHFMLNLIRSISDINAEPVPVLAQGGDVAGPNSDNPLDLTYSKLRGVAPVHVEYLSNMGVGASMSI